VGVGRGVVDLGGRREKRREREEGEEEDGGDVVEALFKENETKRNASSEFGSSQGEVVRRRRDGC